MSGRIEISNIRLHARDSAGLYELRCDEHDLQVPLRNGIAYDMETIMTRVRRHPHYNAASNYQFHVDRGQIIFQPYSGGAEIRYTLTRRDMTDTGLKNAANSVIDTADAIWKKHCAEHARGFPHSTASFRRAGDRIEHFRGRVDADPTSLRREPSRGPAAYDYATHRDTTNALAQLEAIRKGNALCNRALRELAPSESSLSGRDISQIRDQMERINHLLGEMAPVLHTIIDSLDPALFGLRDELRKLSKDLMKKYEELEARLASRPRSIHDRSTSMDDSFAEAPWSRHMPRSAQRSAPAPARDDDHRYDRHGERRSVAWMPFVEMSEQQRETPDLPQDRDDSRHRPAAPSRRTPAAHTQPAATDPYAIPILETADPHRQTPQRPPVTNLVWRTPSDQDAEVVGPDLSTPRGRSHSFIPTPATHTSRDPRTSLLPFSPLAQDDTLSQTSRDIDADLDAMESGLADFNRRAARLLSRRPAQAPATPASAETTRIRQLEDELRQANEREQAASDRIAALLAQQAGTGDALQNSYLRGKIEGVRAARTAADTLRAECDELVQENEALLAKIASMQAQQRTEAGTRAGLESEIAKLQRQASDLQSQIRTRDRLAHRAKQEASAKEAELLEALAAEGSRNTHLSSARRDLERSLLAALESAVGFRSERDRLAAELERQRRAPAQPQTSVPASPDRRDRHSGPDIHAHQSRPAQPPAPGHETQKLKRTLQSELDDLNRLQLPRTRPAAPAASSASSVHTPQRQPADRHPTLEDIADTELPSFDDHVDPRARTPHSAHSHASRPAHRPLQDQGPQDHDSTLQSELSALAQQAQRSRQSVTPAHNPAQPASLFQEDSDVHLHRRRPAQTPIFDPAMLDQERSLESDLDDLDSRLSATQRRLAASAIAPSSSRSDQRQHADIQTDLLPPLQDGPAIDPRIAALEDELSKAHAREQAAEDRINELLSQLTGKDDALERLFSSEFDAWRKAKQLLQQLEGERDLLWQQHHELLDKIANLQGRDPNGELPCLRQQCARLQAQLKKKNDEVENAAAEAAAQEYHLRAALLEQDRTIRDLSNARNSLRRQLADALDSFLKANRDVARLQKERDRLAAELQRQPSRPASAPISAPSRRDIRTPSRRPQTAALDPETLALQRRAEQELADLNQLSQRRRPPAGPAASPSSDAGDVDPMADLLDRRLQNARAQRKRAADDFRRLASQTGGSNPARTQRLQGLFDDQQRAQDAAGQVARERDALRQEKQDLLAQLADMRERYQAANGLISSLSSRLHDAQGNNEQRLAQAQAETERLRKYIGELTAQSSALQRNITQKTAQAARAAQTAASIEAQLRDQLASQEHAILGLRSAQEDLLKAQENLSSRLNGALESATRAGEAAQEFQSERDELAAEVLKQKRAVADLQKQQRSAAEALAKAQSDREAARDELRLKLAAFERERGDRGSDLQAALAKAETAERTIEELRARRDELTAQVSQLEGQNAAQKRGFEKAKRGLEWELQEAQSRFQQETESLHATIAQLRSAQKDQRAQLQEATRRYQQAEQRVHELDAEKTRHNLAYQLLQLEMEKQKRGFEEKLAAQVLDAEHRLAQVSAQASSQPSASSDEEIRHLSDELQTLRAAYDKLQAKERATTRHLNRAYGLLDARNSHDPQVRKDMAALREENAHLSGTVADLQQQLQAKIEALAAKEKFIKTLLEQNLARSHALADEEHDLQDQALILSGDLTAAEKADPESELVMQLRKELQLVNEHLEQVARERDELQEQVDKLTAELKTSELARVDLQGQLAAALEQIGHLKQMLGHQEKATAAAEQALARLSADYVAMESERNALAEESASEQGGDVDPLTPESAQTSLTTPHRLPAPNGQSEAHVVQSPILARHTVAKVVPQPVAVDTVENARALISTLQSEAARQAIAAHGEDLAWIMVGYVNDLCTPPSKELFQAAQLVFGELLKQEVSRQHPAIIYNLAIYLANEDGDFKNSPLGSELRTWMLVQASKMGRPEGAVLQKEELLLQMLTEDTQPTLEGDLASRLRYLRNFHALRSWVEKLGPDEKVFCWARDVLANPDRHEWEIPFRSRLKALLHTKDAQAPSLPVPDVRKGVPIRNASLEEQFLGWKHLQTYLNGSRDKGASWTAAAQQREGLIRASIDEALDIDAITAEVIAGENPEASGLEPTLKFSLPDTGSTFQRLEQSFAAARRENRALAEAERLALLESVNVNMVDILRRFTAGKVDENTIAELLNYVKRKGVFPYALTKAFRQDPDCALAMAQLLYYFNALKDEPKKPHFASLASMEQFNWLTANDETSEISAGRFLRLLKKLSSHPKFNGRPLSCQQAVWTDSIFNVLNGKAGKPRPIHAPPGSGKTSLMQFMVEFIKDEFPETCGVKRVILYSPFATTKDGMECRDLLERTTNKTHLIDVEDAEIDNIAVIVDEGHIPTHDTKWLIRGRTNEKEGFPLIITATPVEPPKNFARRKDEEAFRAKFEPVKQTLKDQYLALQAKHEALGREEWQKQVKEQAKALRATLMKDFSSKNKDFERYIPRPLLRKPIVKGGGTSTSPYLIAETAIKKALKEIEAGDVNYTSLHAALAEYLPMFKRVLENPEESREHLRSFTSPPREADTLRAREDQALKTRAEQFKADLEQLFLATSPDSLGQVRHVPRTEQHVRLSLEIDQLGQSQAALKETMQRWSFEAQTEHEAGAYFQAMQDDREARIARMQYDVRPLRQFFPGHAGTAIGREISGKAKETPHVQVTLHGVRFASDQTLNTFTDAMYIEMAKNGIGADKPVYFVYHDSHSGQRADSYGKDWIVVYERNEDGNNFTKSLLPLEEYDTLVEGTTIMLYDTTFKQGGDFGSLSDTLDAARPHPIQQFNFFNWTDDIRVNPALVFDAIDLQQMMARMRGTIVHEPHVFASLKKDQFVETAFANLSDKQRDLVMADVAPMIAKKLIEAHALCKYQDLTVPGANTEGVPLWQLLKEDFFNKQGPGAEHDLPTEAELTEMVKAFLNEGRHQTLMPILSGLQAALDQTPEMTRARIEEAAQPGRARIAGAANLWQAQLAFEEANLLIEDWFQRFPQQVQTKKKASPVRLAAVQEVAEPPSPRRRRTLAAPLSAPSRLKRSSPASPATYAADARNRPAPVAARAGDGQRRVSSTPPSRIPRFVGNGSASMPRLVARPVIRRPESGAVRVAPIGSSGIPVRTHQ